MFIRIPNISLNRYRVFGATNTKNLLKLIPSMQNIVLPNGGRLIVHFTIKDIWK